MPSSATVMYRDEAARLKSLLKYDILDTLPDPSFDEIARMTASICAAPYAYIGFVDWSRVWFKSRIGFSARQMPRAGSPCQFVVLDARPMLIGDAERDRRFSSSGIRLGADLSCRSYAAAPLLAPSGMVLGTLAVCSAEPDAFGRSCLDDLQVLARQVVTRLELYANGAEQERILRSRQRVERALTVERNFVAAVLDTISALVLVLDTAGRIVRFNRAGETLSGHNFADFAGRSFPEEIFPPEERETAIAIFERARSGELNQTREINWRSETGEMRRIAWTATALPETRNEVNFIIMTGVDVTAQREAESAMRAGEARYRQLIESSLGIVCTHDLEGSLLSINTHAAELLGYRAEELIGTSLRLYLDEGHPEEYESYLRGLPEAGERQGHFHLKRRDGRPCIAAYRSKLLQLPGAAPFVLCHGIDITEQKQAEENLHALMRRHESILESVDDGIWGMDREGRLTFVNRSAAAMLGYTPEEMRGRDAHSLFHYSHADGSPYAAETCPILGSLRGDTSIRIDDDVFRRKDGASFPVEYVACPLMNQGSVEGIVVAFADVTERRRLDRMKDEFISTVSHELRTPLTSLRAALGLIAGGVLEKRPEKVPQMLDIAIGNCDRLVRLVNDIVDFERMGRGALPLHPSDWNAIDLLRRAADAERFAAARGGIAFRIDAQPVDVWVDGDRILQTLNNLIRNAIQFSPRGSEIRLAASVTGDQEVTFEVQDRGSGIAPEKLELIFERFQQADASDSRSSGGAGLGLAMCRRIVEQHGGRIWAHSIPGRGSSFFFTVKQYVAADPAPGAAAAEGISA